MALVMDAYSLRMVEFSEVLDRLSAEASSVLGRQRAAALQPSSDPDLVRRRLVETREYLDLCGGGPVPSLERAADIRGLLDRAAIPGARLAPRELLAIADTLEAGHQFRQHLRGVPLALPELTRVAAGLTPPVALAGGIRRCITPDGAVADNASLAQFRHEDGGSDEQE